MTVNFERGKGDCKYYFFEDCTLKFEKCKFPECENFKSKLSEDLQNSASYVCTFM